MKVLTILLTFCILALGSTKSFAQQKSENQKIQPPKTENQKQRERTFYKQSLNTDSVKAGEVANIMDVYKSAMKTVTEDKSLSAEARKAKIKTLIDGKNEKLRAILTPEQQVKIIPTTEREPLKGVKKD